MKTLVDQIAENLGEGFFQDNIGEFFVVTKPSGQSELADIFFKSDVVGMMRQSLGGLKHKDVVGIFPKKEESKAKKLASKLIKDQ